MNETIVFNYGGGRQTIAMCVMIAKGVLLECALFRENTVEGRTREGACGPCVAEP